MWRGGRGGGAAVKEKEKEGRRKEREEGNRLQLYEAEKKGIDIA